MPSVLTAADRKLLIVTAAAALVLVIATGLLTPIAQRDSQVPTTYSATSGGAKAAYLLLSQLGYRVGRWEQPLTGIAGAGERTLIIAEPQTAATESERAALASFVESGGRLIAIGPSAQSFLPSDRISADLEIAWKRLPAVTPSAITRAAPEITMSPRATWTIGVNDTALPLYADAGRVRVVKEIRGRGEMLWLAAATPLTNAGLRDANNLEFLLAAVGSRDREVIWNEYVHGHGTATTSMARTIAIWIGLHTAIAAVAILVTFSRRSGPVIEPLTESRLSPLEFVRTLGALYDHAGAARVAVDVAYRRFAYQLTRRLGLPITAGPEDLARAAARRWSSDEASLASLLAACERAAQDHHVTPAEALRLTRQLAERSAQLGLSEPHRAANRSNPEVQA